MNESNQNQGGVTEGESRGAGESSPANPWSRSRIVAGRRSADAVDPSVAKDEGAASAALTATAHDEIAPVKAAVEVASEREAEAVSPVEPELESAAATAEASAETPAETPAEGPTEIESDASSEIAPERTVEASSVESTEASIEVSTADATMEATEALDGTSTNAPVETSIEARAEASTETSTEASTETPTEASAKASIEAETPTEADANVESAPSLEARAHALSPSTGHELPNELLVALADRGFDSLTPVQRAVLAPEALGRDLQVSSQTGSGKTVAIGMLMAPALRDSLGEEKGGPFAIVITPTRELAGQVQSELRWLYAGLSGLRVTVVTGGTSVSKERRDLSRGPQVVVGTPGRLLDHIRSGNLRCDRVRQLVLDEADQMLDMGFRDELEGILQSTPRKRATHMVSATFPPGIQRLATQYQVDPLHVEGTRLGQANADIEHVAHLIHPHDRYAAIVNLLLLAGDERALVFVATRADASGLAESLSEDGFAAAPLSGELVQAQRTRTLAAFRAGTVKVLVATDVAARGLDIPDVALVVQAEVPNDAETYTHRSGRTGRAGRKGRCVLLVPAKRERQLHGMLADARVDVEWPEVPTKEVVERALVERDREALRALVDDAENARDEDKSVAASLLEGRDPEQVVANLLRAIRPQRRREPLELVPALSRTRGWKHREREAMRGRGLEGLDTQRDRSDARDGRPFERERGRSGSFASSGSGARGEGGYVRFRVNWGIRGGASPKRLLAMICRRGEVSGQMVGSIDVGAAWTTFEVRASVAKDFESKAGRVDSREPRLQIRRDDSGGGAHSGDRSYGKARGSARGRGHKGGSPRGGKPYRARARSSTSI